MLSRNSFARFALVFALVIPLALFVVTPAFAQGEQPPPPMPFSLDALLVLLLQFAQLPGMSAVVTAITNTLKKFGIVKDGQSGKVVAALNLLGLSLLVYFKFFNTALSVEFIDAQAAIVSQILIFLSGYLVTLIGSKTTHDELSDLKVPVVGFSYSKPGPK